MSHDLPWERAEYDELLDEVDAIDLADPDPVRLAEGVAKALPRLIRAVPLTQGAPTLGAEVHFQTASLLFAVSRLDEDRAKRARAMHHVEHGLALVADANAPLLDALLHHVRGCLRTIDGDVANAAEDFSRTIAILAPHVEALRELRANGNDAEKAMAEMLDRRVHAERVLDEAREGAALVAAVKQAATGVIDSRAPRQASSVAAEETYARLRAWTSPSQRMLRAGVAFGVGLTLALLFHARLIGGVIAVVALAFFVVAARSSQTSAKQG